MKVESSSSSFFIIFPIVFAVLCTNTASIARSPAVPINPFLGIPPQDENYYRSSSHTIKCKDGSATFTKAQLNDDFCDCPDGTDEPGTSACPGGQFYCRNAGHAPVFLFSSRVNDGVCDCCDGSDEYDGQVKCPNTCWEAGKVARDKLKKKIATYKEGVALRNKEVEQAKIAIAKDEAELSKLKNEEKVLKGLVQQLKELKEQIEKAEEKERLQKEKEEKERKESEEKANGEKSAVEGAANLEKDHTEEKIDNDMESTHDEIGVSDDSPADQDVVDKYADHGAEDERCDASKIEGSPVSKVEQHEGQEDEEPVSTKIKDESTLVPETGHDAGNEESYDQPMEEEKDESTDAEGLSKEELGRRVASRWIGNSEKQTDGVGDTKDDDHEEMAWDTHDEEYDAYASETDDDTGKYDDVDGKDDMDETYEEKDHDDDDDASYKPESDDRVEFSDTAFTGNPFWLEKIHQTFRSILQAFKFFQTPVDKSEAARICKEYDESSAKLSKIQSRISSLTQKLKHDFGSEMEFYSFYGCCFESKQNKYVYKVCPFKQASQSQGHLTTRLGDALNILFILSLNLDIHDIDEPKHLNCPLIQWRWEKFEDSYRVMVFSNGDNCWNGPDRSMKVRLRCGLNNEVTDVDEPSRCEYVALLSTPALCLEGKLKELENKLELMKKEEPQSHDEL